MSSSARPEQILKIAHDRANKYAASIVSFFCALPRQLVKYLVNGLIIVIPLAVTLWVIVWVFELVDGLLAPIIKSWLGFTEPGLGLGFLLVITLMAGYLGIKFGHRRIFAYIETSIVKIPAVGSIYDGVRQIVHSISNRSDQKFLKVVFMEFPRKGIYTVGLVTGETSVRGEKMLNVFVPTTPNPFSGFLQIVPVEDVFPSSITVNQAMKLIISAGGFSPGEISTICEKVKESPLEEPRPSSEVAPYGS